MPSPYPGERDVTELVFKGKEFVFNHHLTVPFRPLEMHPDKGIGEPSLDGNLIIHGDNLHALKALLPTHAAKVDCIFIDPPYNTGNEGWSYNDNVNSPMIREWFERTVGLDDGLRRDKWCAMMWPRLRLLHELLAYNGSFWMTLDENEVAHARCILDEIFGEENFVDTVIWQKNYAPKPTAQYFSSDHDYLLVYAKNKEVWRPGLFQRTEAMRARYTNPDNDKNGDWKPADLSARNPYSEGRYSITTPSGRVIPGPPNGRYWAISEKRLKELDDAGEIWWGEDGNNIPAVKTYLSRVRDGAVPQTLWTYKQAGHTQDAKKELIRIFSELSDSQFITPKPTKLLERIVEIAAGPDALVLDSFAGSGTTGHAVLAANARDDGRRRFILVEGEGYANTLTAERIRRVINGYSYSGSQKVELHRETLTWTKLKDVAALYEKVQRCETFDGPKFDRIKTEVKDNALVVTGEREVDETAPGLGGTFTYCTLGTPIEMDALLTGAGLPSVQSMAALLYHTATAKPFDAAPSADAPDIGDGVTRLGEGAGRTLWLIYKPDLEWLKSGAAALTLARARAIAASAPGDHLVFAPAKFVSRELLAAEKLAVEYAPLPFALYRVETA